MQKQAQDPKDKKNPALDKKQDQQKEDRDTSANQERQENSDVQAENERQDIVVNQQEQEQVTNQSASASAYPDHATTDRERSFYRNDLPETQLGIDVDERSSSIQP